MIDPGLKNKNVLVTGGNNPYGIGAATAKAFAVQGAAVFIHYYRQPFERLDSDELHSDINTPGLPFFYAQQSKDAGEIVDSIREKGGRADSWECNLYDPSSVPRLFERAEKELGHIDILVNNAADYMADTFMPNVMLESDGNVL